MNCSESKVFLHADIDGELDPVRSLELERHVKTCSKCAIEKESLRALKTALRQEPLRYEAPASLRNKVRQLGRPASSETRFGFNPLQFWRSLAVVATGFAVVVILFRPGIPERELPMQQAVANHVRSLQAEHLTDVASSDQHTVKPWFNGKLDFVPDVRDFAAQGFPLVGGRMDYLNGREVAALVYRRNKHIVNVFVWPSTNTGGAKMAVQKFRGYSIISHDVNGLHYCLVSDLNENELSALASLFDK